MAPRASFSYRGPIEAPVQEGQQVAKLVVTMPGQPNQEYPLYAADSVRSNGPVRKVMLGLRYLFTPPEEAVDQK